ncbi:hypothetical protein OQA88_776 [Cercophora sp. LCS_1]
MLFSSFLFAASAVTALPPLNWGEKLHGEPSNLEARQSGRGLGAGSDRDGYGFHSGYFYSFWTQGGGTVTYNNLLNGTYKVSWQNVQNWVGGKGWNPGGPKIVEYNGTWSGKNANSYLALYGWTRNPLIEYYVVESFGTYNPSSNAQRKGSITSDGSTYTLYQSTRTNQPSIEGTKTFQQFWSVRQNQRVGGTITVANHLKAYEQYVGKLGTFDYMILGTEGYGSSGSSHITVVEQGATEPPYPNEPNSRKDNN